MALERIQRVAGKMEGRKRKWGQTSCSALSYMPMLSTPVVTHLYAATASLPHFSQLAGTTISSFRHHVHCMFLSIGPVFISKIVINIAN